MRDYPMSLAGGLVVGIIFYIVNLPLPPSFSRYFWNVWYLARWSIDGLSFQNKKSE